MNIKSEKCFLCGRTENLTRDHVPPKNLFIEPLPTNLITVPCCKECNHKYTLDDEAFRIFVASAESRSSEGSWIWKHKVMNSTLLRSPKLKQNVKDSLVRIVDPKDGIEKDALKYPISRANRYLVRLTKGLLTSFYPKLDYSKAGFELSMIEPTQEIVDGTLSKLQYDERGGGIFRFWRAFYDAEDVSSIWVYVFYNGFMFFVQVNPRD